MVCCLLFVIYIVDVNFVDEKCKIVYVHLLV